MAEPERTDQEIDDAIRQWRIRLRDLPDALGVTRERVDGRWEWFRQEVYNRIAEGKSTSEIVEEVGIPARGVAAFRASWTRGYRPESLVGLEPSMTARVATRSRMRSSPHSVWSATCSERSGTTLRS
jgi:hypothetical protein